ncbi:protein rolling stone-like [Neodiprion virginianus]|uniref:protein rolling stone-like n=1 Tax=Neodiprion virginianus TaxID=2961670 RepID=UPI001EE71735|nr:protein rolling stone-like [Neodiprion virginianus]
MVKKFRWQEIRRKLWSPAEPPAPRVFSEPQWQGHVSLWYFLYRWFVFGCWIGIIVCSLFDIGSRHPEARKETWPIYLTHWDLVLGVSQAFLGAILVSRRRNQERRSSFDVDALTLGKIERMYWVLYTVTSSLAICVTITYWGAIYDPRIHAKDPLNFMLHLFNTILMLVDLLVVGVPLRFEHVWWALACVVLYVIFTIFYYLAGGLDKHGYHYIYKILDWEQPGRTTLVCLGGFAFLVIVHCILCSLARLRVYVRAKAVGTMATATISQTAAKMEFALPATKSIELVV